MRVLVFLIGLLVLAAPASAQVWRDPDLGQRIMEGVATSEFLWLRGETGTVVRFDRATGERSVVATGVRDMLADGPSLWVLSDDGDMTATVRDIRGSGQSSPRIGLDQGFVTLAPRPSRTPAVLKPSELMTPSDAAGGWTRTPLAATLDPASSLVALPSGDLYIGYNKGEWGGGVRRIRSDGTISLVGTPNMRSCQGNLNPACEPVVGLFQDPDASECVIAGTGLSHLGMSTGRLYRICEGEVEPIWQTPVATDPDQWMMGAQPWPLNELAQTPDGWIGMSRDRYFRSRDGRIEEHPLPAFREWSGIRISEDRDGVLFIVSACCWGVVTNPTLFSTLAVSAVD